MKGPVYTERVDRGIARLYGERLAGTCPAEVLGAALCVASNFAPYEERRNPYLPAEPFFINFKQGWGLAVYNRVALERAA